MNTFPDIWVFDIHRRVYVDENGNKTSFPIYRHHWLRLDIVGETKQSWVSSSGTKIPKKKVENSNYAYSQEEVDSDVWAKCNLYRMREKLTTIKDIEILKQVASLIGYEETV